MILIYWNKCAFVISRLLIQVAYPLRYCVILIKQTAKKEGEGGSSPREDGWRISWRDAHEVNTAETGIPDHEGGLCSHRFFHPCAHNFFPLWIFSEARQLPWLYGIQQREMHDRWPHTHIWLRFQLTALWDFLTPATNKESPSFWLYKSTVRASG